MTTLSDLEVSWDGLRTLSFRISQYLGHGFWLVCEVALTTMNMENRPLVIDELVEFEK
jgi:hypothetical protein